MLSISQEKNLDLLQTYFCHLKSIKNMKKLVIASLAFSLMLSACGGEETTEAAAEVTTDNVESTTSIEFAEEAFDFGTITQGEKVDHTFKFTNTGESDLVIVSAKGSCGCTVPEWPKEPIAPGETGNIEVVFSSEGKKGKQHKRVSIVANTEPATSVIALKGEVLTPEVEAEAVEEDVTEQTES